MTKRRKRLKAEEAAARIAAGRARQLAHLRRLADIRHPGGLPQNRDGDALLLAMLGSDLNYPGAHKLASWLTSELLEKYKRRIFERGGMAKFTSNYVGDLVSLEDQEREQHRLWAIRPFDVSWHVVQARRAKERSARQNERNKEKRKAAKDAAERAKDIDARADSMLVVLTNQWQPIPEIGRLIGTGKAWRGPRGRPLAGNSLTQALNRTALELVKLGLAEGKLEQGHFGRNHFIRHLKLRDSREGNSFPSRLESRDSRDSRDREKLPSRQAQEMKRK